jgi:hypothetical protein
MPLAAKQSRQGSRRTILVVFVALWCVGTSGLTRDAVAESSVDDLRSEVRQADAPSRLPSSDDDDDRAEDDCDDSSSDDFDSDSGDSALVEIAGWGLLYVAACPFIYPKATIETGTARLGRFSDYPYSENDGYMLSDAQWQGSNTWGGRASVEYGDEFSTKNWIAGRWLVEHFSRFGIDGAVTWLSEDRGAAANDEFFYGDTNVTWRFAQSSWAQMRAGVGVNWLGDDAGSDLGVNFTYGGDFYPAEPFVLSGELDIGSLNHAFLLHLRGTVGVQVNRFELFTGYDYLQLDSSNLHGLVAGVRLWF